MQLSLLKEFLDNNNVKYTIVSHSPAYTAQAIAALAHVPGKELAKTVIIKLDGRLVMAVLPASFQVDFALLKKATKARVAHLAYEEEFRGEFPECEPGAMPPFGNLYGMDVFVDESLAEDSEIAFNAGSHHELIRLQWQDFERLVGPKVIKFASQTLTAVA